MPSLGKRGEGSGDRPSKGPAAGTIGAGRSPPAAKMGNFRGRVLPLPLLSTAVRFPLREENASRCPNHGPENDAMRKKRPAGSLSEKRSGADRDGHRTGKRHTQTLPSRLRPTEAFACGACAQAPAYTRNPSPMMNSTNIATFSRSEALGAPRNSFQTRMPHRADTSVAPCPSP